MSNSLATLVLKNLIIFCISSQLHLNICYKDLKFILRNNNKSFYVAKRNYLQGI